MDNIHGSMMEVLRLMSIDMNELRKREQIGTMLADLQQLVDQFVINRELGCFLPWDHPRIIIMAQHT